MQLKVFQIMFIFNLNFVFTLNFFKMSPAGCALALYFSLEQDFPESNLLHAWKILFLEEIHNANPGGRHLKKSSI
jgi:hypothetical protein